MQLLIYTKFKSTIAKRKRMAYPLVAFAGLSLALQIQAAEDLNFSEQTLARCEEQAKRAPHAKTDEVHEAIRKNDLARASALLGKPTKTTPLEQRFLYGKLQYLKAYSKVDRHEAEKPDSTLLASATKYIQEAARQGYPEALYDQAMLLTPSEQSTQRIDLLRRAADKEFVPAMMQLAEEYFLSSQSFERRIEAQALIQKAAELDPTAKLRLAEYYLHEDKRLNNMTGYDLSVDTAISLYYEVAEQCDPRGAFRLYELAESKHKPNELDPSRAVYWLNIAGELGLAQAQGQLAEYYYRTDADFDKAVVWGERATDNDNVTGMIVLGNIYYQGDGAKQNYSLAMKYYQQALQIDWDNRHVQDQLGMMYYKGEGIAVDYNKAAEYCKFAAHKGQPGCQYYLGLMYVNGEGVTQDIDRGIGWIRKSATQDFTIAKNWLRDNW